MARKELNITKVAHLKGLKIGNQVGSSIGNTFVDIIAPRAGLKKEDYQEIKMDVNEMVAAAAAKAIDAFVSVDPYCTIAEAEGNRHHGREPVRLRSDAGLDLAATPEFIEKNPQAVVEYLRAWLDVGKELKQNPAKSGRRHLWFLHTEGLHDEPRDIQQSDGQRRSGCRLPAWICLALPAAGSRKGF